MGDAAEKIGNGVIELAVMDEIEAAIREEYLRQLREHVGTDEPYGVLTALEIVRGMRRARAEDVDAALAEFARTLRKQIRKRWARDPRELQAVVVS